MFVANQILHILKPCRGGMCLLSEPGFMGLKDFQDIEYGFASPLYGLSVAQSINSLSSTEIYIAIVP